MKPIYVFDRNQGTNYARPWSELLGPSFEYVQFLESNDWRVPSSFALRGGVLHSPFVLIIHGPRGCDEPEIVTAMDLVAADRDSAVIIVGGTSLREVSAPRTYFRKALVSNAGKANPDLGFARCFARFMTHWEANGDLKWSLLEPAFQIPEELAAWALWNEAVNCHLTEGKTPPNELSRVTPALLMEQYSNLASDVGGEVTPWDGQSLEQVQRLLRVAAEKS